MCDAASGLFDWDGVLDTVSAEADSLPENLKKDVLLLQRLGQA